jgi:hypothetical protein
MKNSINLAIGLTMLTAFLTAVAFIIYSLATNGIHMSI